MARNRDTGRRKKKNQRPVPNKQYLVYKINVFQ